MIKLTTENFIERANKIHGNKYDYSKVKYVNNSTKICIICPEHGEFWQTPSNHLAGKGCIKCRHVKVGNIRRKTLKSFIDEAKSIHGNKYDYSKMDYITAEKKVCIICPEHGEFWQNPSSHLNGAGCPKCNGGIRLTQEEF